MSFHEKKKNVEHEWRGHWSTFVNLPSAWIDNSVIDELQNWVPSWNSNSLFFRYWFILLPHSPALFQTDPHIPKHSAIPCSCWGCRPCKFFWGKEENVRKDCYRQTVLWRKMPVLLPPQHIHEANPGHGFATDNEVLEDYCGTNSATHCQVEEHLSG